MAELNEIPETDGMPRGPGLFAVDGSDGRTLITNARRIAGTERPPGSVLVWLSTSLLSVLDLGLFYVSWWGQYLFIYSARRQSVPSMIEAGMLDAGQVILTGLSLGLARQGKPARTERTLILLCAIGSSWMNYLASYSLSLRSEVAFTAAPIFAAIITDRVVSVVRRHALKMSEASPWTAFGRVLLAVARGAAVTLLYSVRLALAPRETAAGLRQFILNAAPLPAEPVADATPTKKAIFLAAYRAHADYGNRAKASAVAAQIAPLAELQPGTARTYAYAELDRLEGTVK